MDKKVTWYETLEYMLNHAENDQRNLSKNFNMLEPAEGCDGSWERMRQMADNIRKEMRDVRFGTKERRGTDYVQKNMQIHRDGEIRGQGVPDGGGMPGDGGPDRDGVPDVAGNEEVQQDQGDV